MKTSDEIVNKLLLQTEGFERAQLSQLVRELIKIVWAPFYCTDYTCGRYVTAPAVGLGILRWLICKIIRLF
jgi:hypothetical protein